MGQKTKTELEEQCRTLQRFLDVERKRNADLTEKLKVVDGRARRRKKQVDEIVGKQVEVDEAARRVIGSMIDRIELKLNCKRCRRDVERGDEPSCKKCVADSWGEITIAALTALDAYEAPVRPYKERIKDEHAMPRCGSMS